MAIQKAIDAAAGAGEGTVVFSAGTYLSGSVYLKSHVTLELEKDAVLLGSPHRMDYQKLNFHGLLLADKQHDITVVGAGVIDGQGRALAADTERLLKDGQIPDAKEGQRPVIIDFRDCTNVTVRDITLKNSACWVEEYRSCDTVSLENIKVRSIAALNNDGMDIDGCSHVKVRGCDIDSEDDGICLKSDDQACDDVLVENCRVRSSCNALKFGTHSHTGFKNIICRNLEIYDTYISGIALEIVDGGEMDNVQVSNIRITTTHNPIFIRLGHRDVNGPVGTFHNVTLSDITADIPNMSGEQMTKFPSGDPYRNPMLITASITGLPGHPVQDVTLKNIAITYGGIGDTPGAKDHRIDKLQKVPECVTNYPESRMFGVLPAWGFYCRHAEGLKFENVNINVKGKDYRPALVCDDVQDIQLNRFHIGYAGREPVIVLNDVQGAVIQDCPAPPGATEFIRKMGNTTEVEGKGEK